MHNSTRTKGLTSLCGSRLVVPPTCREFFLFSYENTVMLLVLSVTARCSLTGKALTLRSCMGSTPIFISGVTGNVEWLGNQSQMRRCRVGGFESPLVAVNIRYKRLGRSDGKRDKGFVPVNGRLIFFIITHK